MTWRERLDVRFASLARFVVRFRWLTIAASLLVVAGLAAQVPHLAFDTSTEGFLHPGDPILVEYNAFRDQFGRDELIVLVLQPPDPFDLAFLETLRSLHTRIEDEVPHLEEVTSLINARATRGSQDELLVEDLLEAGGGLPARPGARAPDPSERQPLSSPGRFGSEGAAPSSAEAAGARRGVPPFFPSGP
jgi:hypothetical protein